MKIIVRSSAEKFDFFLYYIFMIIFCAFTAWNSIVIGKAFALYSIIGGASAILSGIILYSYFHHIARVRNLLKGFIFLLLILFVGSAITEIVVLELKLYPFVMKCSLYAFCIVTPLKQLRELNKKWAEYERHR